MTERVIRGIIDHMEAIQGHSTLARMSLHDLADLNMLPPDTADIIPLIREHMLASSRQLTSYIDVLRQHIAEPVPSRPPGGRDTHGN